MRMDNANKAIALCKKQLEKTPNDAFVHNILGEIHLKKMAYTKALKAFNKAIDLAPNSFIPYRNLATTYTVQKKTGEAIKQLEKLLKEDPENIRPAFLIGVLSENANDRPKALSHYRMVVEKEPNFMPALNNLAFLIAEKGGSKKELKEALQLALRAVRHAPDSPNVKDTLGWVYYKMGEYERAYGQLQKLLDKGVVSPVFNYHLGMVLYKQGRSVEAREYLEKALEKAVRYVDRDKIREVLKELG
jgi:tetratricopeptide (TPR) repeat protein